MWGGGRRWTWRRALIWKRNFLKRNKMVTKEGLGLQKEIATLEWVKRRRKQNRLFFLRVY